jgi:hypothetical protein
VTLWEMVLAARKILNEIAEARDAVLAQNDLRCATSPISTEPLAAVSRPCET